MHLGAGHLQNLMRVELGKNTRLVPHGIRDSAALTCGGSQDRCDPLVQADTVAFRQFDNRPMKRPRHPLDPFTARKIVIIGRRFRNVQAGLQRAFNPQSLRLLQSLERLRFGLAICYASGQFENAGDKIAFGILPDNLRIRSVEDVFHCRHSLSSSSSPRADMAFRKLLT